jgi:hypothetical protein
MKIHIPSWDQPNCPNFCAKSQALALLEKAQGSSAEFRGFSTDELNHVVQHGTFIRPKVGQKVVVAGELASFFMLVLSGAVEVVNALESTAGNKILIQKGELLGDLALLMASRPMIAYLVLRLACSGFVWRMHAGWVPDGHVQGCSSRHRLGMYALLNLASGPLPSMR